MPHTFSGDFFTIEHTFSGDFLVNCHTFSGDFCIIVYFLFSLRHRVIPRTAPGMTAADALEAEP